MPQFIKKPGLSSTWLFFRMPLRSMGLHAIGNGLPVSVVIGKSSLFDTPENYVVPHKLIIWTPPTQSTFYGQIPSLSGKISDLEIGYPDTINLVRFSYPIFPIDHDNRPAMR